MEPKFGEVWEWNKGSSHVVVLVLGPSPSGPYVPPDQPARTVMILNQQASLPDAGYTTDYWGWDDEHWQRIA